MDGWIDFYDSAHPIYVNARHRDVHFQRIAEDLAAYVRPGASVLDYGCGEALRADILAAKAGRLILVEPAAGVRARLAARVGAHPKIEVRGAGRPRAVPRRPARALTLALVAQWLTA